MARTLVDIDLAVPAASRRSPRAVAYAAELSVVRNVGIVAHPTGKTSSTLAAVRVRGNILTRSSRVHAYGSVLAGRARALIHVDLATTTHTDIAAVRVLRDREIVVALSIAEAGIARTRILIDLKLCISAAAVAGVHVRIVIPRVRVCAASLERVAEEQWQFIALERAGANQGLKQRALPPRWYVCEGRNIWTPCCPGFCVSRSSTALTLHQALHVHLVRGAIGDVPAASCWRTDP